MFLVFDDLKIVPSSMVTSMQLLMELGYSDLTQLEEVTHSIGKQEVLVIYLTIPMPSLPLFLLSFDY
jgi:hypothetical protein